MLRWPISIEEGFRFAYPQRTVARHHRLLFWFLDSAYSEWPLWVISSRSDYISISLERPL
jgi:hypothetical protein